MNDFWTLTDAERAGMDVWNNGGSADSTQALCAVRAALRFAECRREQSEDAQIAILREALAAVRDIAYRASGDGARDALEAIHARACRALNEEN